MMKNKKLFYGALLVCLLFIIGFGLYHYFSQKQVETNPMVATAKAHLQKYVHNAFPKAVFSSLVTKTEVIEGECEANKYWERWGQPPIESPSKHPCWIIRFYYPGPAEGSHLVVFVDKNTNEVIGGTQTK